MAIATATVMGLWGSQASALSLGRIAVLSALGEPLRAEIEILDINADEASSLKTSVAQPDAFRTAGLEYNPVMNSLQISLQQRADGRSFFRISSDRAINDPYVDLILEASWATGRIVRDYTMLFDPPNLKQPQVVTPVAPQVSSAPARITAPPVQPAPAPAAEATAPAASAPTAPAKAKPSTPSPTPAVQPKTAAPAAKRITVKSGDTASKIAAAQRSSGISLEQMLVAMQRANPDAFIDGNVNRIRSGAVLNMPGAEEAQATPTSEAHQIIVAQSRDFNEFRRKLASSAPISQVAAADRKASGTVQAKVEEKKSATTPPDKLTLSKGAVQSKTAEDKIAKEREAKETATRADEIAKNIAELNKLSKASAPATSEAKPAAAPVPTASAVKPAVAPTLTTAASTPTPATTASAPKTVAAAPAKRPPAPVPAPVEEPGLIDELLDNPLVPAAAGGLVALLAGLGFYRIRQRKKAAQQVDSAYLESRLQPDSFFGASGGQRVDTNDNGATGSSMVYSPSQLDSADDVDPVAEADVYLAYGRDLQAEEILKEALRTHPSRLAIHQKLLEIYAKRRDLENFEDVAKAAFKLTGSAVPEWEHICGLGRSIDPDNALYQPGAEPPVSVPAPTDNSSGFASTTTSPTVTPPPAPASSVDLDLDLDFSLDEAPSSAISEAGHSPSASTPAAIAPAMADNSMEFDAPLPELTPQTDELSGGDTASPPLAPAEPATPGMMEFDLGSLSLDLGAPSEQPSASSDDPLATKLALADEFSAIGDTDGARALIEEIIAEASGEMKARAQKALSQLG